MDMKRDYFEDIRLLKSGVEVFWFGVLVLFLTILPFLVPGYTLYMVNFLAINVIVAVGLNILIGNTGQISLGHAGFLAIGSYATVLATTTLGLNFLPALLLGGLMAALFGLILGLPALRLEGPYLAIATLGFGLAIVQVIGRFPVFGGRMGLSVPAMELGDWKLNSDVEIYFVVIPITFLLTLGARNLLKTRVGRAFEAIRDSDIAASTLGINLAYYKTLSFAVSAFYAGIAGGLLAFVVGFINPGQYTLILSVLFFSMVVVGGLGTILGSILGGISVGYLNLKMDVLGELPILGAVLGWISEQWMLEAGLPSAGWLLTGLALILFVVFEPLGLYGLWLRTRVYWKTWPF